MICPRCREENSEDNIACSRCALKLRVSCPDCGLYNEIGQVSCSGCGKKLLTFCPQCKVANSTQAAACRKCGASLAKEQTIKQHTVLAIELINLSVLNAKIKNPNIVNKLLKKFYQAVAYNAKVAGETAIKVNDSLMAIEFKKAETLQDSCIIAISAAQSIIEDIEDFNFKIKDNIDIKLKIKAGISVYTQGIRKDFARTERSIAAVSNIVVSQEIKDLATDVFNFELAGKLPINEKIFTFYKISEEAIGEISAPPEPQRRKAPKAELIPSIQEEKVQTDKQQSRKVDTSVSSANFTLSQDEAFSYVTEVLLANTTNSLIGIKAPLGGGKTTLISLIKQGLPENSHFWLNGIGRKEIQTVPFALISDLLKNLLDLPVTIFDTEEAQKSISTALRNIVGIQDNFIEYVISKIILNGHIEQTHEVEIDENQIYECIKLIIYSIALKKPVILHIEDMENIDRFSFECLKYLVQKINPETRCHIICTYSTNIDLSQILPLGNNFNHHEINLRPHTEAELFKILQGLLNGQDIIPTKLKNKIITNANGLPFYIEQAVWLLFQCGAIHTDSNTLKFNPDAEMVNIPQDLEEVIKFRLSETNKTDSRLTDILLNAAVLGLKFVPALVQAMTEIPQEEFGDLLTNIQNSGYIVATDRYNFAFKHKMMLDILLKDGLSEPQKVQYNKKAFELLSNYSKTDFATLALFAQKSELQDNALNLWHMYADNAINDNCKEVYIYAQQNVLSIIDSADFLESAQKADFKTRIFEDIGKRNYLNKGTIGIEYLSNAILEHEKQNNNVKVVELLGYLSKSCFINGNYAGVVECVDKTMGYIDETDMPLEKALTEYTKLQALYEMGNVEEALVSATNDILPIIEENLKHNASLPGISTDEIRYISLKAELVIVKALAIQGRKECLTAANNLILRAKAMNLPEIHAECLIAKAYFSTLCGDRHNSSEYISELSTLMQYFNEPDQIRLYVGIINIISTIIGGRIDKTADNTQTLVSMAERYNKPGLACLIKLLSGKLLKENGDYDTARQIFNDGIGYAAQSKFATGALLGWYFIASLELALADTQSARSIAEKALEISEKPNINNSLFILMFNKLLADIHIAAGELELAQVHAEKAFEIAKNNGMLSFQAEIYLIFGKIYQESATVSEQNRESNVKYAHQFLINSLEISQNIENEKLIISIEKELTNLSTFCQLSGITI